MFFEVNVGVRRGAFCGVIVAAAEVIPRSRMLAMNMVYIFFMVLFPPIIIL